MFVDSLTDSIISRASKLPSRPLSAPASLQALVKLPPDQQLLLSLRVKEAPTVMLQNKKATVSIPANIHVLSYLPAGTPEALFELNGVSGRDLGAQHGF